MRLDDSTSLGDARAALRAHAASGEDCPLCKQYVKVYRRKLNSNMARWLIRFHHATSGNRQWTHATHAVWTQLGEEYSKLAHWHLIEKHPDRVGFWRETELGVAFVLNEISVESHAVVYDGECLRLDGTPVSIVTVLGKHFDYAELMRERPESNEPQ